MTSPAITKSTESQKAAMKSPSHSAPERAPSRTESQSSAPPPAAGHPFGWMRIFKLTDLMMKQGC